jgi:hypothetical protein
MKRPYLTSEGMPVMTNCPQKDWTEITEEDYKKICKERNDQIAADQARQEKELKPLREEQKLINERMKQIAKQQLIDEGIL